MGTTWVVQTSSEAPQPDLPATCYTGKNLALNTFKPDRRSSLPENERVASYAAYAAAHLTGAIASENLTRSASIIPARIVHTAERIDVKTVEQFFLVYHLFTAVIGVDSARATLGQDDMTGLLGMPLLAADLLTNTTIQTELIDMALADREWWQTEGWPALARLRDISLKERSAKLKDALAALANRAIQLTIEQIRQGKEQNMTLLVEGIALTALPPGDKQPWRVLYKALAQGGQPHNQPQKEPQYTWPLRAWLLTAWARIPEITQDPWIQPWLTVVWDDLGRMLDLSLPREWRSTAVEAAIVRGDLDNYKSPEVLKTIEDNSDLFESTLLSLLSERSEAKVRQLAIHFFVELASRRYSKRISLLHQILQRAPNDLELISYLLDRVDLRPDEVRYLLSQRESTLIVKLRRTPVLEGLAEKYLRTFNSVEALTDASAEWVLGQLASALSETSTHRSNIRALHSTSRFLKKAAEAIDIQDLKELADAVNQLKIAGEGNPRDADKARQTEESEEGEKLGQAIVTKLVDRTDSIEKLVEVLNSLGGPLAKSPSALYAQMTRAATHIYRERWLPRKVSPFLQFGMTYIQSDDAKAALRGLMESLTKDRLNAINQIAERSWPPKAQAKWHTYMSKERPRSITDYVRNLLNMNLVYFPVLGVLGIALIALLFTNVSSVVGGSGGSSAGPTATSTTVAGGAVLSTATNTVSPTPVETPTGTPTHKPADTPAPTPSTVPTKAGIVHGGSDSTPGTSTAIVTPAGTATPTATPSASTTTAETPTTVLATPSPTEAKGYWEYIVQPGDNLTTINDGFCGGNARIEDFRNKDGEAFPDPNQLQEGEMVHLPNDVCREPE